MIFSKKKENCNVEFKYGNNILEVVESYTYLGLNLICDGKLKLAIETLSNQATRAIFVIKKLYNYNNLDVYSKMKLFESIVVPILCYGCEVWGFDNVNDIEKIQIRFYKNLLELNRNTSNISVFGELGRYPLNIIIKERIIKYWLKSLMKNDVRNKMYQQERYAIVNTNNVNWASKVKNLLYSLRLNYIWDQQDYIHETQLLYYTNICKVRLKDRYVQHFFTNISNNIRLEKYCIFKNMFCFEEYLYCLSPRLRTILCKFRCSSHNILIEQDRNMNIDRMHRLCQNCNSNVTEDEYCFLLACSAYRYLRIEYLKEYYYTWSSIIIICISSNYC